MLAAGPAMSSRADWGFTCVEMQQPCATAALCCKAMPQCCAGKALAEAVPSQGTPLSLHDQPTLAPAQLAVAPATPDRSFRLQSRGKERPPFLWTHALLI